MKLIGHLFFLSYLVFAWCYADERVFFVDSAAQLFELLNSETFNIVAFRYSTFFAELLPLAFIKAGASLALVVKIYSINYVLLYYGVFLICAYGFKNWAAAWLVILSHILAIRLSAYHTVSETHQAFVYSSLFFAWISQVDETNKTGIAQRLKNIFIGCFILGLAYWVHPISVITIFVVYIWSIHNKRTFTAIGKDTFVLLFLIPMVLYKLVFATSGYESGFINQVADIPILLPKIKSLFSYWFLKEHFKYLYRPTLIVFLLTTGYMLLKRKWFSVFTYNALVFGGLLFILMVFNSVDSQIMMERAFMPMTFIVCLPFCVIWFNKNVKWYQPKMLLVITLLVVSWANILKTGKYFTVRQNYLSDIIQIAKSKNLNKVLIDIDNTDRDLIFIPWAVPVETLLKSAVAGPKEAISVLIRNNSDDYVSLTEENGLFRPYTYGSTLSVDQLNKKYFILNKEPYTVVDTLPLVIRPKFY